MCACACERSTTSGSVARASGVRPSGKGGEREREREREREGNKEASKQRRADQKGVFSKRLSHNGTVRVTSFLTSCQVASLTAASVLLCRRQLDVARLLTIAPANDEAGDVGVGVTGTKLRRRVCRTPMPTRYNHQTTARRRLIRCPELKRCQ